MLQEDNQDQTTVDLARVMLDTAVLRSGYDLQVQSTTCSNSSMLSKPFAMSTPYQCSLSDTGQLK